MRKKKNRLFLRDKEDSSNSTDSDDMNRATFSSHEGDEEDNYRQQEQPEDNPYIFGGAKEKKGK